MSVITNFRLVDPERTENPEPLPKGKDSGPSDGLVTA